MSYARSPNGDFSTTMGTRYEAREGLNSLFIVLIRFSSSACSLKVDLFFSDALAPGIQRANHNHRDNNNERNYRAPRLLARGRGLHDGPRVKWRVVVFR